MKVIHVFFMILLALAGLALAISLIEAPPGATGVAHATIAGMRQVTDARARLEPVFALGAAFGALIFAAVLAAIYLGVPAAYRSTAFKLGFSICGALLMLSWIGLLWSYRCYVDDPAAAGFFLGFPAPTAWLLYGVSIVPASFIALYVYGYERWIFPPEAEQRFNELMAQRPERADRG
jgi:hypothetical protein